MKKLVSLCLALLLCVSLAAPACAAGFSDVPASHYAAAAIDSCVAAGVASGYADGTFRPSAPLTNAQFCVMVSRAFYPERVKEYDEPFYRDFGWYGPNVFALMEDREKGRKSLLDNVSFQWDAVGENMDRGITRYDMAQLMTNIMADKGFQATEAQKAQASIHDYVLIPEVYQEAVKNVFALGIITGYADGSFGGDKTMNRGQGCAVIGRMGQYIPIAGQSAQKPTTPAQPAQPTQPTQPTQPAPNALTPAEASAELMRLLNAQRTKAGLKALGTMDSLTQAAQTRAKDLSGGYIEIRADGSDWTAPLIQAGVPADYVDESFVVGKGYDTPAKALEKVLETPSAVAALTDGDYTHMSVGYVHDPNGYDGYQDFWSILYIVASNSGSSSGGTSGGAPSGGVPSGESADLQSMRQGVLELVNAARAQNGAAPLTLDSKLCDVAQLRAEEIVQSFSHTRPNGTSCFTAVKEAGISNGTLGENIAAGQSSPASVMDSWMNSEGHRKNILNSSFTSIGIGYVKAPSGYGHYWVQMFMG